LFKDELDDLSERMALSTATAFVRARAALASLASEARLARALASLTVALSYTGAF